MKQELVVRQRVIIDDSDRAPNLVEARRLDQILSAIINGENRRRHAELDSLRAERARLLRALAGLQ